MSSRTQLCWHPYAHVYFDAVIFPKLVVPLNHRNCMELPYGDLGCLTVRICTGLFVVIPFYRPWLDSLQGYQPLLDSLSILWILRLAFLEHLSATDSTRTPRIVRTPLNKPFSVLMVPGWTTARSSWRWKLHCTWGQGLHFGDGCFWLVDGCWWFMVG